MEKLEIVFDQETPTEIGLYLTVKENTTEPDGAAMDAVWVFFHRGLLHFMSMGDSQGRPLTALPWLQGRKWSKRLTVAPR